MILYTDPSALVKRYVEEQGSDAVARWLEEAEHVVCCRVGFVEVYRAVMLAGPSDPQAVRQAFERDWGRMTVLEVHDLLVRRAAVLAISLGLRSLAALHLGAAESLQGPDLWLATWDRRLWQAARFMGLQVLPEGPP